MDRKHTLIPVLRPGEHALSAATFTPDELTGLLLVSLIWHKE